MVGNLSTLAVRSVMQARMICELLLWYRRIISYGKANGLWSDKSAS